MTPPIQTQVALVTGANAGMGLATARALLQAGYRVAVTDLHTEQAASALVEFGDRVACFTMTWINSSLFLAYACADPCQCHGPSRGTPF